MARVWPRPPIAAARRHAQAGIWRNRTIAAHARDRAAATPDAVVYPNDPARPTYETLLTEAEALAAAMHGLGLRQGDVVAFQLPNWVEAAIINLAACIAGAVVNPIVPIYRDAEIRHMLTDGGAKFFFYPGQARNFDYAAMVARLRPGLPLLQHAIAVRGADNDRGYAALVAAGRGRTAPSRAEDPDAVKLLLYTSGTTGPAKAVLHSHNSLDRVERISCDHWGIRPGDVMLMPSPVTHISGYANGLELPFLAGTRSVLMESWNAQEAIALIERYAIIGTVAATPFLTELAAAARAAGTRLPTLRVFACGGASVPAALVAQANRAFARPCAFRVYGASEAPLVTLGFDPVTHPDLAAATDGAVIDYELRIVDDTGAAIAAGGEGEILVRGPSMFIGYANEAETAAALTADGFFRTGDLGRLDHGALIITGRKKDLIIRGGENISPREIEEVLLRHPAVRDAAIVAMPHPRLGEGVCAFIVAASGPPDPADLAAHVIASGLARQKCPERFEFVDALPQTPSGKVRKDALRARIADLLNPP